MVSGRAFEGAFEGGSWKGVLKAPWGDSKGLQREASKGRGGFYWVGGGLLLEGERALTGREGS